MAPGPDLHRIVGHAVAIGRRVDPGAPSSGEPGQRHVFQALATVGAVLSLRPEDTEARQFCRALAEGDRLVLTHALPDGAMQTEIVVERWSPAGRVLTAFCPSPLAPVQRRDAYRVPVGLPLTLACARGGKVVLEPATTLDVSTNGIACTTALRLRRGELVAGFLTSGERAISGVLQVVEAGDGPKSRTRLRILEITPTDLRELTLQLRRAEVNRVGTAPSELRIT